VVSSGGGTETAGTAFSVTLTAQDTYGNTATGYNGAAVSIAFTSTATNAPDSTSPTITTPQTLDFSVTPGIVTTPANFTLVNAGETPTITASDGAISGTTAAITVQPEVAASFSAVTSGGGTETAGTAFSVTLTAQDTYGNTATGYNGAAVSIAFTSTATNAPDSASPTITTPQTLDFSVTPGIVTTPANFTLVNAGETPTISASDGTISGTTAAVTVQPGVATWFTVVTSGGGTETAGTAFSVTLTAQDTYGNTATGYNGAAVGIAFTSTATNAPDSTSPTITTSQILDFSVVTPGIVTTPANFTLVNAGETPTITATDGTISGTTAAITVNAGALARLAFTTAAQTLTAGISSAVMTVQTQDAYWNPSNAGVATVVNLSTTGSGQFSVAMLPWINVPSLNIGAGTNSISFYYKDIIPGTPTTTAASTGLTSATQTQTVVPVSYSAPPPTPVPPMGVVDLMGRISPDGVMVETISLTSADGNASAEIPAGTNASDAEGNPLAEITCERPDTPAPVPPDSNMIAVYDFGPDGATFDPPLTMTIEYDPALIPGGGTEEDLVIAYFDIERGEWVVLDSVVDPITRTVTAQASHFTEFAILGLVSAPTAFTLSDPTVVPAEVEEGETAEVTVDVANTGELEATQDINLVGGATTTEPPAPAAFTLSNFAAAPAEVEEGETAAVTFDVTNTGELEGSYTVTLLVDNMVEATRDITLAGGGTTSVSFSLAKEAGSYQVEVDGLVASLEVTEPPAVIGWWVWVVLEVTEPPAVIGWWVWVVLGLGVVVAAMGVHWVRRRPWAV
jgi:hypothetical protein